MSAPTYTPCPDPLRCRYWKRFASGPWTCEACHPREVPRPEPVTFSGAIDRWQREADR